MNDDRDELFREEALEYLARQRGPGELLQVQIAWMNWAYVGFLALVLLGVVAALVIRVDGEPLLYVMAPALHG